MKLALALSLAAVLGCYHLRQVSFTSGESVAPPTYTERCSTCHGATGRGDGLAGQSLDPRPRDFASPEWQAHTTDARIEAVIRGGGAAVGLSPLMPAQPDLSRWQMRALVTWIRQVGESGGSE